MDAPLATHYDVYQGTDCPAPDYPDAQYVEVTESELTGLSLVPSTTYCWKVVSIDDEGCFTEGDTWTFETICPDPTAPTVTSATTAAFLAGSSTYVYTLTFSEDVQPLTSSDLTWTAVTGSGTLDSVTQVDPQTYDIEFSGAVNGDEYTLTVETSVVDVDCGVPLDAAVDISIYVNSVCELTSGTDTTHSLPMDLWWNYSYTQSIYTPSDLCGAGTITTVGWDFNGSGASTETIVVYMGHTTTSTFAGTTSWLPVSSMTQVYSGSYSLPTTAGFTSVTLTTPFAYNGTDNLVIAVDRNTGSYITSITDFYAAPVSGNVSIEYHSDSTNPNPSAPTSGTLRAFLPNLKIEY